MLDEQLGPYDGIWSPADRQAGNRRHDTCAKYARTRKVPYFGICLGMECAVIEFARDVCGFRPTVPNSILPRRTGFSICCGNCWGDVMGGNMRLAPIRARWIRFSGKSGFTEKGDFRTPPPPLRVQPEYEQDHCQLRDEVFGKFAGWEFRESPSCRTTMVSGLPVHPEFKSKPMQPHPLFRASLRLPTP